MSATNHGDTAQMQAREDERPSKRRRKWSVRSGERAAGILNPIRKIMDELAGKGNPDKSVLSLAQGDPTSYPHLRPGEIQVQAATDALRSGFLNGYQPSQGNAAARTAVAKYFNLPAREALKSDDVFMTTGTSEALSHCIAALGFAGSNMLLPRPGFPLYQVICDYMGVQVRYYDLLSDRDWEVDVEKLASLADDKTCGILINNPSNPCGAVYSAAHLAEVMKAAEELRLPVIADEVYHSMSFDAPFVACATAGPNVPVLSVCALSKRWLAPGWRVGWIIVHDHDDVLKNAAIPDTLLKLCQVSLGPSAPLQAALPTILDTIPKDWYEEILGHLKQSADVCVRRCCSCPGLELAAQPKGAMYLMVRIKPGALRGIADDIAFAGDLLAEESVVVLPGQCFEAPGYFRVVFAAPPALLEEAWDRMAAFCTRRSTVS